MKKFILLLFILTSCEVIIIDRHSFVQGYCEYGDVLDLELTGNNSIGIRFKAGRSASIESTGEDKQWFDNLCEKNNDIHWSGNQRIGIRGQYLFLPICLTPDLVALDVFADVDLDQDHPAGSSLSDWVEVSFESDYDYVQSGYTKDISSIYKHMLLSSITENDLKMLEMKEFPIRLVFTKQPMEQIPPFSLTVNGLDSFGRNVSGSVEFSFSGR